MERPVKQADKPEMNPEQAVEAVREFGEALEQAMPAIIDEYYRTHPTIRSQALDPL
jgi:hypothetical protein